MFRLKQKLSAACIIIGFLLGGLTAVAQDKYGGVFSGDKTHLRQYVLFLPENKLDTVSLLEIQYDPVLYYKVNSVAIDVSSKLDSVASLIGEFMKNEHSRYVRIGVTASPDGISVKNRALAERRAEHLIAYLQKEFGIPGEVLRLENLGEDWFSVERYLRLHTFPYRERILEILAAEQDDERRKAAIRLIDNGKTWRRMVTDIFPTARAARILIVCTEQKEVKPVETVQSLVLEKRDTSRAETTVSSESKLEAAPKPKSKSKPDPVEEIVSEERTNPYRWAIKTNAAYLAATVANIGGEYYFGKRYSVDLPLIYSPYTVSRSYRLRFLAIQPEFRYWLKTSEKGHFLGAHLNIGAFNISVDKEDRYQSPDGFYGVGLSYGYLLPFAGRWAVEFTLGAGYVHTKYDTYYNIPDGVRYEKGCPYDYWGLTKVGINLVYRFKK